MRKGLLGSVTALLASAGLAYAEAPVASPAPSTIVTPAPAAPIMLDGAPQVLDWHEGDGGGGPQYRFWGSAEYLLWWLKSENNPALVTTGPTATGGVLAPGSGAVVLFGDRGFNDELHSGGRFTAGLWLNDCQTCGLEADFFFLGKRSDTFTAGGSGAPGSALIARPFFDTLLGIPSSELVAFPGLLSGSVSVRERSGFNGWDVNMVHCCINTCTCSLEWLAGFRALELDDSLTIHEDITVLPGIAALPGLPTFPFIPGNRILVTDKFDTQNYFYGGQVGLRGEARFGRLFVNGRGLVALGETHEVVGISGGTSILTPAGTLTLPGGLFALSSNSGRHTRDQFAVVPEIDLNVGVQVTQALRLFVGYTWIYWSDVVRPGDQINTAINPTLVPTSLPFGAPATGAPAPLFHFRSTDFWAQGINLGVEFRY